MRTRELALITLLSAPMLLPALAQAQLRPDWPGGGPGPYSPYASRPYRVGNPYAGELTNSPSRIPKSTMPVIRRRTRRSSIYRDARWKFMIECMNEVK